MAWSHGWLLVNLGDYPPGNESISYGRGTSSSKQPLKGDMLLPWKVNIYFWFWRRSSQVRKCLTHKMVKCGKDRNIWTWANHEASTAHAIIVSFRIHARKFHILPTNSLASIKKQASTSTCHIASHHNAITWLVSEPPNSKKRGVQLLQGFRGENFPDKNFTPAALCKNPITTHNEKCLQVRSWKKPERSVVLLQHCVERHPHRGSWRIYKS